MNNKLNLNLHYLSSYKDQVDLEKLNRILIKNNRKLLDENNIPFIKCLMDQPVIRAEHQDFSSDAVEIGKRGEIDPDTLETIENQLKTFCPWRKGPFNIFGLEVDAEWKSDLKWNRFRPHMESLKGKKICDVGCNNGYFMFKMENDEPEMVLGIDPTRRFKLMFHYLNNFAKRKNLHMELLGFEDLDCFDSFFDAVFCMGILYHHESPMEVLRRCYDSMNKGGVIYLDTMGISSRDEVCLFPEKKYAKMPNVWFLPSESATENMLKRAGFRDIKCIFNEKLSIEEQRRTGWADVYSLKDFLDPDNPQRTVEGYEAPSRIYFVARK